jgi:DNA repair exonuclease SbcCD nuclease subunit/molybdopterin-guanine dinucleotide biosynthesis protein
MKLLLLHLSDIHITNQRSANSILSRAKDIAAAISSIAPSCDACMIIVSGDIAYSGRTDEYILAKEFFDGLKRELTHRISGCVLYLFFTPGNHDCDFSLSDSIREMIITHYSPSTFDSNMLENCHSVQKSYDEFASSMGVEKEKNEGVKNILDVKVVKLGDQIIEIRLINSALLSTLHEKQGALFYPTHLVSFSSTQVTPPQLIISVLHHPYNWFESTNARSLRDALESTSDIILTGHEHEEDDYKKTRSNGEEVEYIEGSVLQDPQQNHSQFNALVIDLEGQSQRLHKFLWDKSGQYLETGTSVPVALLRNSYRLRNQYSQTEEFSRFLLDPGATYTNSAKEQILLDDIFVYPHLRVQPNPNGDSTITARMIQENIPGFIEDAKKILVIGTDKSGKTSLAKKIFQDLRKRGFVPVYISGSDIKRPNEPHISNVISRVYQAQYHTPDINTFNQLEKEQRVYIVDDFHTCPVNSRGRDQIISELEETASIIVLLADERIRYEDLADRKIDDLRLWQYTAVEIMPFGHVKRHELIRKWLFIGKGYTHDELELLRQVGSIERSVSELIGNNLVPSYPIFILAILQQIEAQTPIQASSVSGSYGFLYEALLTISLTRASKLKLDLDTQYSYLSEFAYHLFVSGVRYLSENEAFDWNSHYCAVYKRRLDYKEIVTNIVTAGIFSDNEGKIAFRYPYLFYYFLGRYFRDHISDEKIREHIVAMSRRLHHEESANVLMFLSYLSKDPIILDSITNAAQGLFPNYDECNLIEHSKYLNDLINEIPQLILTSNDSEERRKEVLEKEDIVESKRANCEDVIDYSDVMTDDQIEELLRINVAFKTIQILGQILRNYPGSLRGDEKLVIARQAYSLGLRVLRFMYSMLEASREDSVRFFADLLREKHPTWAEDDITRSVRNLMFYLSEGLAFVITKHVADSVGHKDLSMTFDELLQANSNISFRTIDVSIRLYNYDGFPKDEILSLFRDVRKSPLAAQLVRHIVWYYFYIYPVKETDLQSICKKLGIQIQPILRDDRPKMLKN